MFYLADGHAEFVGNKQNNAESQNRPADDTAVPQPLHAVGFERQSGDDGRNCSDNNQPEELGTGIFEIGNEPGFEDAFEHHPDFFRKVNHDGHNRTDMHGNVKRQSLIGERREF